MNLPLFSKFEIQDDDEVEVEDAVKSEKGLSELVRLCLGKPLNKSEQISNWEKRPLRKSQIQYAGLKIEWKNKFYFKSVLFEALDAFCLVEIFDFLRERVKELKIDFDFLNCIGKKYKHSTSNPKSDKASNQNEKNESKPLPVQVNNYHILKKFISRFFYFLIANKLCDKWITNWGQRFAYSLW